MFIRISRWLLGIIALLTITSAAYGQMRGEFTGGTTVDDIDINDAVYLLAWLQVLQSQDISIVTAHATSLFAGIQGTLTDLPSTDNADFTGDAQVDINDVVALLAWLQVFKDSNPETIESRAVEMYSNFQGTIVQLPGSSGGLKFDQVVSNLSLGAISIKISGGVNVDYSTYSTTTKVVTSSPQTLTKSISATNIAFPTGDGIVLNYSGIDLAQINDFDTLAFSPPLPENALVQVLNGNAVVASATSGTVTLLQLTDLGNQTYQVNLVPLQEDHGKKLAGLNNVGVICPSFSNLTGVGDYEPSSLGFNEYHSISLMDLDSTRATLSNSLGLYSFTCVSTPSLQLGEKFGLNYVQTEPITGTEKIIAVNL